VVRDLMLHLKSLLWCLNKDRKRYNLRVIIDCLNARHVPESIRGTPLGKNLNYLIDQLSASGSLAVLLNTIKRISQSKQRLKTTSGNIELGQYLKTIKTLDSIPPGSFGVVSFLGESIYGLFYLDNRGILEKKVMSDQVEIILGTRI